MKHRSMLGTDVAAECYLCLEEEKDLENLSQERPVIEGEQKSILMGSNTFRWLPCEFSRLLPIPSVVLAARTEKSERALAHCSFYSTNHCIEQWIKPDLLIGTDA